MLREIFKSYRALPLRRGWRSLTLDRANRGRILSGHLRRRCGKYNYWVLRPIRSTLCWRAPGPISGSDIANILRNEIDMPALDSGFVVQPNSAPDGEIRQLKLTIAAPASSA